jgi:hypothetical protein
MASAEQEPKGKRHETGKTLVRGADGVLYLISENENDKIEVVKNVDEITRVNDALNEAGEKISNILNHTFATGVRVGVPMVLPAHRPRSRKEKEA